MWSDLPKYSKDYRDGVTAFINNAFAYQYSVGDELRCPCKLCLNFQWHLRNVIFDHLVCNGVSLKHVPFVHEVSCLDSLDNLNDMECESNMPLGDDLDAMLRSTYRKVVDHEENNPGVLHKGLNSEAQKFYRLMEEGKQPLYPGCNDFSRLRFIVELYLLKYSHGVTESFFSAMLAILRAAFPFASIPKSFRDAKNTIKDLGLDYQKIHACPNDCIIYWGVNANKEVCATCGLSRWKGMEKDAAGMDKASKSKIPAKVMRYFPLKPRLQRLFLSKEYSQLMRWHAVERKIDGKLRHPVDGDAWKRMDIEYPDFSSEIRNVRLGLASDGFNPYRTMSISHSTWPIILVNYNLPPWLSMKAENLILSTLISGPTSPGNNIDVYMQPLIQELKDLWHVGIESYDALADETFLLRASVLWTISDYPGLSMLKGWKTRGTYACVACNYKTNSTYLHHSKKMCYMGHRKFLDKEHKYRFDKRRFDGKMEMSDSPQVLTGSDIEILLARRVNVFGRQNQKDNENSDSPWKKKSIFFELPY